MLCAFGLPERPIELLTFENINAEFLPEAERVPERPVMMDNFDEMSGRSVFARNVKKLVMKNVIIKGCADTEPELIDVEEKAIEGVQYI